MVLSIHLCICLFLVVCGADLLQQLKELDQPRELHLHRGEEGHGELRQPRPRRLWQVCALRGKDQISDGGRKMLGSNMSNIGEKYTARILDIKNVRDNSLWQNSWWS